MRHFIITASLLATTAMPSLAQGVESLHDGLLNLPSSVLTQQYGDIAYFLDIATIIQLAEEHPGEQPLHRLFAPMTQINFHLLDAQSEWWDKSGTSQDKLRYMTGYGRPPNVFTFWGLGDETAASDMIANLSARGFEAAGTAGVIGNGEPMRIDPTKRDPSDPWRTSIGAAQFAAAKGSNVVQAQNPQSAALAAAAQDSLGENPFIQIALDGLEQSVGEGRLVQAVVVSPLFGMAGFDPATLLSPSSIEDTKEKLEQQMEQLRDGVPPYLIGIVADVQQDTPELVISLAYPDCNMAQAATDIIADRWITFAEEPAQGEISGSVIEGNDGLCAAVVSVVTTTDGVGLNPAFQSVMGAYVRGQVGVLQIGTN